jgi:hypothetical protein
MKGGRMQPEAIPPPLELRRSGGGAKAMKTYRGFFAGVGTLQVLFKIVIEIRWIYLILD